jgi:predicted transposase YbfD/YdcC
VGAEVVALEGKTVRRSFDSAKRQSAIHLLSAWASANRLVLGQIQIQLDDQSNGITAVPELQRTLELAGCIVTVDALNCQKHIAKEIRAVADSVPALKRNHETTKEESQTCLDAALEETFAAKLRGAKLAAGAAALAVRKTVDKGHGRMETRRCFQSAELDWLADRAAREGLTTVEWWKPVGKCAANRRWHDANRCRGGSNPRPDAGVGRSGRIPFGDTADGQAAPHLAATFNRTRWPASLPPHGPPPNPLRLDAVDSGTKTGPDIYERSTSEFSSHPP